MSSLSWMCADVRRFVRVAIVFFLSIVGGSAAFAHDGFSVAVAPSWSVGGPVVVAAHATLPVADLQLGDDLVTLSARADVAFSVIALGLPSLGVAGMVSQPLEGAPSDVETYLGAGIGMAFAPSPLFGSYVFGGGRAPIAGGMHGFWELHLAVVGGAVAPSVMFGIEYAFGGPR